MVTLYEKESGKAVIFAHIIDAKESMKTGFYVSEDPTPKREVLPEKSEAKPAVIPKVEDKKPVAAKTIDEPAKPIVKKNPKIIKK